MFRATILTVGIASVLCEDPLCERGLPSGTACCALSCGVCGGSGCSSRPGGASNCCGGAFSDRTCDENEAPCTIVHPDPATQCGDYPEALSTTQPNVLLIGDSISEAIPFTPGGYGGNVRTSLTKLGVNVWHQGGWLSGGQASSTIKGLRCTDPDVDGNWLNVSGTYDVAHFNFGLHDLVDPGPGEGAQHVDLGQYGANIAEIYGRLSSIAKTVIFATTTPCPNVTTSMGRTDAKVRAYNADALAGLQAMGTSDFVVDDLHQSVISYCGTDYKTCDLQKEANVHFEAKGCAFLGDKVTQSILDALGMSPQSVLA